MARRFRIAALFTLLFAGVSPPAAADPLLMFLIGVAREMVTDHAGGPKSAAAPEILPDPRRFYPGTQVEPAQMRRLIDESFLYLGDGQRREIFEALNTAILDPRNAAVRGAMIEYFAEKAYTVRQAQLRLAQLTDRDKARMAAEFKADLVSLNDDDLAQLEKLLRSGLLPVPSDLNQLLLAAFEDR